MKPKQDSPIMSEPGKKRKGEFNKPIISLEGNDVKLALESAMTCLFKSRSELDKLRRKARVVRDG